MTKTQVRKRRKVDSKHVAPGARAKPKHAKTPSQEVTPNDVIGNLLSLFKDLGLDVSHPTTTAADVRVDSASANTLYPYASAIGELLTTWHQDPKYLDASGSPLPIRMRGSQPSFHNLMRRLTPSLDEAYLLSELERLGAVTIDEKKYIRVHMRSFPVYEDKRLAAKHTVAALDGFITTLRHNLNSTPSNSDQLFHRIAWNGNFDPKEIPALKVRMRRHGQNFLESFDDWLMQKQKSKFKDNIRQTQWTQVSIGVYLSIRKT